MLLKKLLVENPPWKMGASAGRQAHTMPKQGSIAVQMKML